MVPDLDSLVLPTPLDPLEPLEQSELPTLLAPAELPEPPAMDFLEPPELED